MPDILPHFLVDMHISMAEEEAMGIAEEYTKDWRDSNEVPGSDAVEEACADIAAEELEHAEESKSAVYGGQWT